MTSTLAYYNIELTAVVKSFIVRATGVKLIKKFSGRLFRKLDRFNVLGKLFKLMKQSSFQ